MVLVLISSFCGISGPDERYCDLLGVLDHSGVPVPSLHVKVKPHLRRTECRASTNGFCTVPCHPESDCPCLLLLGAVHTNVYILIYNLLAGWLIKYIGFRSSPIVSIFQIGFAADMVE